MFKEKGQIIMTTLHEQIKDWEAFMKKVKLNVQPDDSNIILHSKFIKIMGEYGKHLNDKEKDILL